MTDCTKCPIFNECRNTNYGGVKKMTSQLAEECPLVKVLKIHTDTHFDVKNKKVHNV